MKDFEFPFVLDKITKQSSVTLMFCYLGNVLALVSLVVLHVRSSPIVATTATCIYAFISTILYLIRRVQHAKIDVKDQSIELDAPKEKGDL